MRNLILTILFFPCFVLFFFSCLLSLVGSSFDLELNDKQINGWIIFCFIIFDALIYSIASFFVFIFFILLFVHSRVFGVWQAMQLLGREPTATEARKIGLLREEICNRTGKDLLEKKRIMLTSLEDIDMLALGGNVILVNSIFLTNINKLEDCGYINAFLVRELWKTNNRIYEKNIINKFFRTFNFCSFFVFVFLVCLNVVFNILCFFVWVVFAVLMRSFALSFFITTKVELKQSYFHTTRRSVFKYALTRQDEYKADDYAFELGYGVELLNTLYSKLDFLSYNATTKLTDVLRSETPMLEKRIKRLEKKIK